MADESENTSDESEKWSWLKYLSGLFNGLNWAKASIFGAIFILEILIGFCVWRTFEHYFLKPKPIATTIQSSGGSVDNSTTKQWNSILGFHFGGTNNG